MNRAMLIRLPGLLLLFYSPLFVANAGLGKLALQEQVVTLNNQRQAVRIPRGYQLELLTDALDGPRLMTFAENGDLLIGSNSGNVYRLPPPYTKPEVLLRLDDYPHSVAIRPGELLIAQTHGLYRVDYQAGQKHIARDKLRLLAALPGGGGHNSRSVGIGPDGNIYLSLGISGNCSDQYLGPPYSFAERRGGFLQLDESAEVPVWRTFATGLRNPVGFAWHPRSGKLYASNNGPDHLGYEQPPEYFSLVEAGSFHGMPWYQFNGKETYRDQCIKRPPPRPLSQVVIPVATFPARNAPMGVTFVTENTMDKRLVLDAIVALHGSWATRASGGYFGDPATRRPPKIVVVRFSHGKAQRVDDLISGFQLENGKRWARPVGVKIGPDGALYFTSDGGINGLFRLRKIQ